MYSWLFRKLPGKRWLKFVQAGLLILIGLALLYSFVFPWLDSVLYSEPNNGL